MRKEARRHAQELETLSDRWGLSPVQRASEAPVVLAELLTDRYLEAADNLRDEHALERVQALAGRAITRLVATEEYGLAGNRGSVRHNLTTLRSDRDPQVMLMTLAALRPPVLLLRQKVDLFLREWGSLRIPHARPRRRADHGRVARLVAAPTIPVLTDAGRPVAEASVIIEHLGLYHPGPVRLVPEDPRAALAVRMMDRFFDNYVMTPMQKIVFDHMRAPRRHGTSRESRRLGRCSTAPTAG